jgi:hypothetical protein
MVSLCVAPTLSESTVSSASIAQGRLTTGLPDWLGTLFRGSGQRRSAGAAVRALDPRSNRRPRRDETESHVRENLGTARIPGVGRGFSQAFEVQ